jgi:hypothetical protein
MTGSEWLCLGYITYGPVPDCLLDLFRVASYDNNYFPGVESFLFRIS